jgi:hypothetical protein
MKVRLVLRCEEVGKLRCKELEKEHSGMSRRQKCRGRINVGLFKGQRWPETKRGRIER